MVLSSLERGTLANARLTVLCCSCTVRRLTKTVVLRYAIVPSRHSTFLIRFPVLLISRRSRYVEINGPKDTRMDSKSIFGISISYYRLFSTIVREESCGLEIVHICIILQPKYLVRYSTMVFEL